MSETLVFDVDLKEVQITLKSAKAEPQDCKLIELTGDERDKYLDMMGDRVKFKEGKPVGLNKYEGFQCDLLCLCLHGPGGALMTKDIINKLPARVQTALYKTASTLSGLDEKAVEKAKKE